MRVRRPLLPLLVCALFAASTASRLRSAVRPRITRRADAALLLSPTPSVSILNQLSAKLPMPKMPMVADRIVITGIQACLLCSFSDTVTQLMHDDVAFSVSHVQAMAAIATVLSGSLGALWLDYLEHKIPGTDMRAVFSKTACDCARRALLLRPRVTASHDALFVLCCADVCCATIFNSAYLACVPMLTALFAGDSPQAAAHLMGWTHADFNSVMAIEAMTFVPYNLLQFKLVPPQHRPLASASLSAVCTIALSSITLGFGWSW